MNHAILCQRLIFASALLLAGGAVSCTTVVTPLSTSDLISTDASHGLLVGHIRLAWDGADKLEGRTKPLKMNWSIEEETKGTHFVLTDLPTAGPFVMKLPVGFYRVNDIRFGGISRIWHTMLPTTFLVESGSCTSLGTWELKQEADSFADWITGRVFKEFDPTHVELQQVLAALDCPTVAASTGRSKLAFQNRLYPWP